MKENKFVQQNLFGLSSVLFEPKKIKHNLSPEEKASRKEKSDAHRAWKLLKSRKFTENLTEQDKYLLKKYYNIILQ